MKNWLLAFCVLSITGCAGNEIFKDGFDNEKTWIELEAQLPEYPKRENFLEYDSGSNSSYKYYVDEKSIQVGDDGVIRFSLIVESSAGAMNVSFEGIRCQTTERKRYALGQNNGTWIESHVDDWQFMQNISQFHPHRELATYYFCPIRSIVGSEQEAIRALKTGMNPKARSLLY